MTAPEIIRKLKKLGNAKNVEGMARFGITAKKIYGVCTPNLMMIARQVEKSPSFVKAPADAKALADKPKDRHDLAQQLWQSEIFEARILAGMIDRPEWVTDKQMDAWVSDFDSWAVCDSNCMRLFSETKFAHKKVWQYARSGKEFIRRTAFALIASLTVHDKKASDEVFIKYLPLIKKYATDERNYVRKAVNWALRQIGKRNLALNKKAIACAEEILRIDNKTARWIAGDALRELKGEAVQKRLKIKHKI